MVPCTSPPTATVGLALPLPLDKAMPEASKAKVTAIRIGRMRSRRSSRFSMDVCLFDAECRAARKALLSQILRRTCRVQAARGPKKDSTSWPTQRLGREQEWREGRRGQDARATGER